MRYKDIPKVPFVYKPCAILPGIIAVPVSELSNKKYMEKLVKDNKENKNV